MKATKKGSGKAVVPGRNILIGSRRTSVRLEPVMWAALADIASERGKTVHDVLAEIDRTRDSPSLSSAIRIYIVEYYRTRLKRGT